MRCIKEVLRQRLRNGMGVRAIARSCSLSHSSVSELLRKAETAGLTWEMVAELDEPALEARLYPAVVGRRTQKRPEPDLAYIHRELLRREHVTLQLLWTEYKEEHADGLQYTQFCERYRRWSRTLDPPMRQTHRAGEKMFVDFAGDTIAVTNPRTGEILEAQLFVACLGASNYTYAEACRSQDLWSWIQAHIHALQFFGGVPTLIIPDNLRSGVKNPSYYEPEANPTYQDLAEHYDTMILPARPGRSRDKAKVENAVLHVERWIIAALRNEAFTSLTALNERIAVLLEKLNARPFRKLDGSRRSLYEEIEKPQLKPLPSAPYDYAAWKKAKVNIDYHVSVEYSIYSVPYQLIHEAVDVRLSAMTVEIFHEGRRVASHARSYVKGSVVTNKEHMPASHRAHAEWTPSRMISWAGKIGPQTSEFVTALLAGKPHPEHGYRACLGIFRLAKAYTDDRIEAACERALACGAISYKSMASILKTGQDRLTPVPTVQGTSARHENLRGDTYFAEGGQG